MLIQLTSPLRKTPPAATVNEATIKSQLNHELRQGIKKPSFYSSIRNFTLYTALSYLNINGLLKEEVKIGFHISTKTMDPTFTAKRLFAGCTTLRHQNIQVDNQNMAYQAFCLKPTTGNLFRVVGRKGLLLLPGYRPVTETTFRFIGREMYRARLDNTSDYALGKSPVILISHKGYDNYYHWLAQTIPRLFLAAKLIHDEPAKFANAKVYMSIGDNSNRCEKKGILAFQLETLTRAIRFFPELNPKNIHIARPGQVMQTAGRVAFFTTENLDVNGFGRIEFKINLKGARQIMDTLYPAKPIFTRSRLRWFISRSNAHHRQILNRDKVAAVLEKHGFKSVNMEDFSVEKQINRARGAEMIVGPHGAGLANILFCSSGTQVIEFNHPFWKVRCYKELAQELDLPFNRLAGTPTLWDRFVKRTKILKAVSWMLTNPKSSLALMSFNMSIDSVKLDNTLRAVASNKLRIFKEQLEPPLRTAFQIPSTEELEFNDKVRGYHDGCIVKTANTKLFVKYSTPSPNGLINPIELFCYKFLEKLELGPQTKFVFLDPEDQTKVANTTFCYICTEDLSTSHVEDVQKRYIINRGAPETNSDIQDEDAWRNALLQKDFIKQLIKFMFITDLLNLKDALYYGFDNFGIVESTIGEEKQYALSCCDHTPPKKLKSKRGILNYETLSSPVERFFKFFGSESVSPYTKQKVTKIPRAINGTKPSFLSLLSEAKTELLERLVETINSSAEEVRHIIESRPGQCDDSQFSDYIKYTLDQAVALEAH